MNDKRVGVCIRHKTFVDCVEQFDICGGPHVRYALRALRDSGVCDRLFFYSPHEEEMKAASALGYHVVEPFAEQQEPIFNDVELRVYGTIARELKIEGEGQQLLSSLFKTLEVMFFVDGNMPLLTPEVFLALDSKEQDRGYAVYASTPIFSRLMLQQPEERVFPLFFDATQVFYQPENRPQTAMLHYETKVLRLQQARPGTNNEFFHMLSPLESLYVSDRDMARLAEAFLQSQPGGD